MLIAAAWFSIVGGIAAIIAIGIGLWQIGAGIFRAFRQLIRFTDAVENAAALVEASAKHAEQLTELQQELADHAAADLAFQHLILARLPSAP